MSHDFYLYQRLDAAGITVSAIQDAIRQDDVEFLRNLFATETDLRPNYQLTEQATVIECCAMHNAENCLEFVLAQPYAWLSDVFSTESSFHRITRTASCKTFERLIQHASETDQLAESLQSFGNCLAKLADRNDLEILQLVLETFDARWEMHLAKLCLDYTAETSREPSPDILQNFKSMTNRHFAPVRSHEANNNSWSSAYSNAICQSNLEALQLIRRFAEKYGILLNLREAAIAATAADITIWKKLLPEFLQLESASSAFTVLFNILISRAATAHLEDLLQQTYLRQDADPHERSLGMNFILSVIIQSKNTAFLEWFCFECLKTRHVRYITETEQDLEEALRLATLEPTFTRLFDCLAFCNGTNIRKIERLLQRDATVCKKIGAQSHISSRLRFSERCDSLGLERTVTRWRLLQEMQPFQLDFFLEGAIQTQEHLETFMKQSTSGQTIRTQRI